MSAALVSDKQVKPRCFCAAKVEDQISAADAHAQAAMQIFLYMFNSQNESSFNEIWEDKNSNNGENLMSDKKPE